MQNYTYMEYLFKTHHYAVTCLWYNYTEITLETICIASHPYKKTHWRGWSNEAACYFFCPQGIQAILYNFDAPISPLAHFSCAHNLLQECAHSSTKHIWGSNSDPLSQSITHHYGPTHKGLLSFFVCITKREYLSSFLIYEYVDYEYLQLYPGYIGKTYALDTWHRCLK